MRRALTHFAIPMMAIGLAACSVSTTKSVDSDELAAEVKAKLTEQVGEEPEQIDCPEDLPAEEGATTQCTLTHGGTTLPVDVTVTGVQDDNVSFNILVGETPVE